jgi:hypothetical protein
MTESQELDLTNKPPAEDRLHTRQVKDLSDEAKTAVASEAVRALSSDAKREVAATAVQTLSTEDKKDIAMRTVQELPPEVRQDVAGNPHQRVTDTIWLTVVRAFAIVLVLSAGMLFVSAYLRLPDIQVVLTVFTTIAGILAGFISGRSSASGPLR